MAEEVSEIRKISVYGVSEISCLADSGRFEVCIRSSKESPDDLAYIEEVVKERSNYVTPIKLEVYKTFSKEDNTFVADVKLNFSNLHTCDDLWKLLIEKLDSNAVDIGPVQLYHSQCSVEKLRYEASVKAAVNARNKAYGMAEKLLMKLGEVLMVHEEKSHEWFGLLPNSSPEKEINFSRQQQKMATKSIKCEVQATFEMSRY